MCVLSCCVSAFLWGLEGFNVMFDLVSSSRTAVQCHVNIHEFKARYGL